MVGAAVLLATASSGGGSPLASLGAVVSILASLATVVTVVMMLRQERNTRQSHEDSRERDYEDMRRDFYGDKRPGVPSTPGVLEMIEVIHSEITPNHGGSIKDAVGRIETKVSALESQFNEHMGA